MLRQIRRDRRRPRRPAAHDARMGANVVHEVGFARAFHAFEPEGGWMVGR